MSKVNYDLIKNILTSSGYSWTRPRQVVFTALFGSEPSTINELINKVSDRVDRVSVYRTIELFEKLGIVRRINIGWKYKLELSDRFVAHHHHLTCLKCGRLIDIEDEKHIDNFIEQIANRFDFQPKSHQFEIEGICSDCRDD